MKIKKSVKKRLKVTKKGKVIHIRSGRVFSGRRARKIKKMLGK